VRRSTSSSQSKPRRLGQLRRNTTQDGKLHAVHTTSPLHHFPVAPTKPYSPTMSRVSTRCPNEFNDWVPWELIFHLDRFFCIPDTTHKIDYFAFITSRLAAVAFLHIAIALPISGFLLYRQIRRDLRTYHRAEEIWLRMRELENGQLKDGVSVSFFRTKDCSTEGS
jgi:hypothetical protein